MLSKEEAKVLYVELPSAEQPLKTTTAVSFLTRQVNLNFFIDSLSPIPRRKKEKTPDEHHYRHHSYPTPAEI